MNIKDFLPIPQSNNQQDSAQAQSQKTTQTGQTNVSPNNPNMQSAPASTIIKPSEVLLEWEAPERLFKKRSREFYRRLAVILIFFALLFLIIKEFLLILLMGVFFFVVYVFTTIPPRIVKHQLTTNGINYASDHEYKWQEYSSFFFEIKNETNILVMNTVQQIPGRMYLLLPDSISTEQVQAIVNQFVSIIEKPEQTYMDKIVSGMSKRLNI